MAAIDFPNSPTNGQKFTSGGLTWTYQTGVGWLLDAASGVSGGFTFMQDAVPTATAVGQTWFQTSTGDCFVWHNDGNSSQWIEFVSGGSGYTYVSDVAPTPQQIGDTWFDLSTGASGGSSWVAIDKGTGALVWVQSSPGASANTGALGIVAMGAFTATTSTASPGVRMVPVVPISLMTITGRRYRATFNVRALSSASATFLRVIFRINAAEPTSHVLFPSLSTYSYGSYSWVFNGSSTVRSFDIQVLTDSVAVALYHEGDIGSWYIEDMGAI